MPTAVHSDISSPSSSSSSRPDSCPDSEIAPGFSPLTTASSCSSSSEPSLDMVDLGSKGTYGSTPAYPTFKIVGDNLDKYVKPRDMRVDAQASTLHYFNMYAVRDRLDTSQLPDNPSLPDASIVQVEQILPTEADYDVLYSNFILVCRVLKKHMPFFAEFCSGIEKHIQHIYSEEMSKKSEVVSVYVYA